MLATLSEPGLCTAKMESALDSEVCDSDFFVLCLISFEQLLKCEATAFGDSGLPEILAKGYSDLFQSLGNLDDLESALKFWEIAVAETPSSHPDLAGHQQNLAKSYTRCFERLGNLDDLESALKYDLAAVVATPIGHPDLAHHQYNLAVSYNDHFQRQDNLDSLELALKHFSLAVAETPIGHPDLASYQTSLAVPYTSCFKRLGNLDDLESALKYNQAAVAATPMGHPDLADYQYSLAVSYNQRFQQLDNLDDLESASALKYNQACHDQNFSKLSCDHSHDRFPRDPSPDECSAIKNFISSHEPCCPSKVRLETLSRFRLYTQHTFPPVMPVAEDPYHADPYHSYSGLCLLFYVSS